jgi:hypothetical protein
MTLRAKEAFPEAEEGNSQHQSTKKMSRKAVFAATIWPLLPPAK